MLGGSLLKGQKVFLIVFLFHFLKKQKKHYIFINIIFIKPDYLLVTSPYDLTLDIIPKVSGIFILEDKRY